ncbi:hypothetical protein PQI66_04370 [Corynebacterium sp. USCH3]|uniref:hypothetical protein n=1 Tax=Corynebacterium sp. USCH3 TaxID=3024840 RepID=UPI00309F14B3
MKYAPAPELIRAVDAIRRYGVSMGYLDRRTAAGELNPVRDPKDRRCRLFSVDELDSLITPAE